MEKENVSFDFRLKRIDETKNYILEEIKYNDLMSGKHRKVCGALSYLEHFFFSVVSGVSISAFSSLVAVPVGIASSAVGSKILAIAVGIKIISQSSRKN